MHFFLSRFTRTSFLSLFLISACAQIPENQSKPIPAFSIEDLKNEVNQIGQGAELKYGGWAVSVKSTKSGQPVLEHNSSRSMIIASNMKVVTTASGLAILGEDYTFKTELQYDGVIDAEGLLNGNLYIKGGGDPTLGSDRVKGSLDLNQLLALWTEKIKAAGIRKINGAIIGDADIFNENVIPGGWTWADLGNYYGSPAYGLNINDNLFSLSFVPGKSTGAPTRILSTYPAISDIEFVNEVITGAPGSGDNAYIYGVPYTSLRYVQGSIPGGVQSFSIRGAIPDPVVLSAELLHKQLGSKGIMVSQNPSSTRLLRQKKQFKANERKSIYTHVSPPLKDIVYQTNLQSMNLYAEAVAKMLGVEVFHDGTTVSGTNAIEGFWKQKDVDLGGFFMRDGSGLSRTNAITASTMTAILGHSAMQPYFQALYNSLPVAGVSGTMAGIGRGTAAQGNVRAKTGTIERVMSYSGYFTTRSGELMSFAIIANDYDGSSAQMRKKVEKLMTMLVKLP
jgi:D-alanyl-D-alanine carboxypeptidase/D-alanyl-D-alanine-endopeptidase (penicillin-binding protein 4)